MKYLNIVIIWNDETYSTYAPYGWQVGSTTKGETTHAPEIGKAQLKRVLNAIDPAILIDSASASLDTIGIPDELRNGEGIPSGPYTGKLKNVRIYKINSTINLSTIENEFDGNSISSLIFLNSGFVCGNPNIYSLLRETIDNEIGVMFIGSESAMETQFVDTSRAYLPIMGAQQEFRFKAFTDDVIKEFDFDNSNNTSDWDVPDTVKLSSDNISNHYMIKISGGSLTNDTLFKKVGDVISNRTIYPNDNILTKYGEWSIKAKAVTVIPKDLYAPEMTTGIYTNHDLILVSDNNGKVTIPAFAPWSSKLWANNEYLDLGEEIVGLHGEYDSINEYFNLLQDFIKVVPNNVYPNIMDSIFVLRKETKIPLAKTASDIKIENYMDSYLTGGYRELRIDLKNIDKKVFKNVFPSLNTHGITSLKFKPWSKNGRISCDADIWAFNEKCKLGVFDSLYEKTDEFDSSVYYVEYLGDQIAISEGQFIKPAGNETEFDKPLNEMTLDSLGFERANSYGNKIYHTIGVVQKNHHRVMLIGFQPSYLEDTQATQSLLSDGIKWISSYILNHNLPKPKILPKDSSIVKLDIDTITVIADFFQKSEDIKKEGYFLICTVKINSVEKIDTITVPADAGTAEIDSFKISLSSIGFNNTLFKADDDVSIKINLEPTDSNSYVHASSNSVVCFFESEVSNQSYSFTNNNCNIPILIGNLKYSINMSDLRKNRNIEIALFNLKGRKIKTLYKGELNKVLNEKIEISNLSKGIYLISFKGNISSRNIKILYK